MRQFPGDWFAYSLNDPADRPPRFEPLVSILIRYGERTLTAIGLVDTGSDATVLSSEFAHRLGIDESIKDAALGTLGGDVPASRAVVGLRIHLLSGDIEIQAADVLVVDPRGTGPAVVLGRNPVLLEAELRVQEWKARFALIRRQRAWLEFPQPRASGNLPVRFGIGRAAPRLPSVRRPSRAIKTALHRRGRAAWKFATIFRQSPSPTAPNASSTPSPSFAEVK